MNQLTKFLPILYLSLIPLVAAFLISANHPSEWTAAEQRSYAAGVDMGSMLKRIDDLGDARFQVLMGYQNYAPQIAQGCMDGLADPTQHYSAYKRLIEKHTRAQTGPQNEEERVKIAHAIGYMNVNELSKQGNIPVSDFDKAVLELGINHGFAGEAKIVKEYALYKKQLETYLEEKKAAHYEAMQTAAAAKIKAQLEEGKAFLADNKTQEGVVTTESGLQYQVLQSGKKKRARRPVVEDRVKVHYHGTLLDGTVFDSSVDRGTPQSFDLKGVISGWAEGLQLMKEGDKFRFFIPQELGYGLRGFGSLVPAGATLIFDVELLEVNPKG